MNIPGTVLLSGITGPDAERVLTVIRSADWG